jgi:hypothetical protein
MSGIVRELKKKNLKRIITEKKWKRSCPKCGTNIFHKSEKSCYEASRLNKRCRKCFCENLDTRGSKNGMWNPSLQRDNFKRMCPVCKKELIYSNRYSFQKAEKENSCCRYPCAIGKRNYEQIYTPEIKKRMSKKAIERVKKLGMNNGTCPFYNKNACSYFDKLNESNGWNLQHALNSGEVNMIGYCLDAYDRKRNIIVEYDEPAHFYANGNLKKKDITRMEKLINHLKCQFYRYNETTQKLIKYA